MVAERPGFGDGANSQPSFEVQLEMLRRGQPLRGEPGSLESRQIMFPREPSITDFVGFGFPFQDLLGHLAAAKERWQAKEPYTFPDTRPDILASSSAAKSFDQGPALDQRRIAPDPRRTHLDAWLSEWKRAEDERRRREQGI